MSVLVPGEPRMQDVIDTARGSTKCRIPQRLPPPSGRSRPPFNNVSRPKGDAGKQKCEVAAAQHNRFVAKNSARPRSDELSRPKSANRAKDDLCTGRAAYPPTRFPRTDRFSAAPKMKLKPTFLPKRPSNLPKLTINETSVLHNKGARTLIMVPVTQRPVGKNAHTTRISSGLPDQETIKKHEELELRQSQISDATHVFNDSNDYDKESITSRSDKAMQLKICWQEKMVLYEQMKNELTDRQKAILELYAVMRNTHQIMASVGERTSLPPVEDLRIMNVTKMTPEQLLQLCAGSATFGDRQHNQDGEALCKNTLAIDVQKLYNMPSKLVETCEQTLLKRKEIIDWFDSLKSQDKGISVHKLSKKINEFNAENEMLKCSLDQVKAEFVKELEEIFTLLRKCVNDTIALQLRSEEMTYEMSELNSQNADLRKQIQNADHLRSQTNKTRIEELQKELKEEKCKRIFLRDRLSRAEGQVKMNQERASQLEAALEQARSQTWSLERTVQQLHDQNQKLQSDFDKELSTLTESIKKHTVHLEEIADAREKLQTEKEDLEKRLAEIAEHYNESLNSTKHEMNVNVVKLIEIEKNYEQVVEDKIVLEAKVESLCAQLLETEQHLKDATKQMQEKENELDKTVNDQKELESIKQELHEAHLEIFDYKNGLAKRIEVIEELERNYKESISLQQSLKRELSTKEEYIEELEKKQALLKQQLQENENKMEAYVEQLTSLKTHITQLQEDFGEFENLNDLHEQVNLQRAQLLDVTRQNGELAEALQKKEEELEQFSATLAEQDSCIEQREGKIKILTEKEEEQSNIIKILRNNLALRSDTDNNFNQQLAKKNAEINALITEIEMGKEQMSNLEKIILTLQEQASIQIKKDQDKIAMLQNRNSEYEAYRIETSRIMDAPTENIDNLIKIIEDELGSPVESQIKTKDHEYNVSKKKYAGDCKRNKHEYKEKNNEPLYQSALENNPAKVMMGNLMKKCYIPANEKHYEGENLDRKRANTSIDTQKWKASLDPGMNAYNLPVTRDINLPNLKIPGDHQNLSYLTRNLQYMAPNQFREDRKGKMYKLAGHRL